MSIQIIQRRILLVCVGIAVISAVLGTTDIEPVIAEDAVSSGADASRGAENILPYLFFIVVISAVRLQIQVKPLAL